MAENRGIIGKNNPPVETQFKPGVSGNPNGRPPGTKNMSTILNDILENKIEIDDPFLKKRLKQPAKYAVLLKLTQLALKGDMRAIKEILDRLEGSTDITNINVLNQYLKDRGV